MLNCLRLNSWFVTSESLRTHLRGIVFHRPRTKVIIEDDQTLSVQVCFKFQWTRDLLCWFVPSSLSGSGMCEDGFAGDDAPYAMCLSIDDNPEMPGTMDQKDSNEALRALGAVRTPARHRRQHGWTCPQLP